MKKLIITFAAALMILSAIIPGTQSGISQAEITWSSLPPCPFYISRANCVKVGDYVYVEGGMGGGFGSWWVTSAAMNIHTEEWTNMTPMPVQLMNMSLVAVRDSIFYALPSMDSNFYKYEPTAGGPQGVWSVVAPMPNPAISTSAAFDGDHNIYLYVNGLTTNVHECYALDINTETLTAIADIPTIRYFPGAAWVNGKFYLFGGQDVDLNMTDNCYEYDSGSDSWTEKSPLIRPSCYNLFNTVVREDLVYLVGGGEPESWPSTDSIQVYDPSTDQWSIYETLRQNSYGVNVACYVPEYDYLFDCGGVDGSNFYDDAWKGLFDYVAPDVIISLSPETLPIVIPAMGGSFDFLIQVDNNELNQVTADVWTMVTLPNGSEYGPIINAPGLSFSASSSVNRSRTQLVPAGAPAGDYVYHGYIGNYPNMVYSEDSFNFSKSTVADGNANIQGWDNWGEGFGIESDIQQVTVEEYQLLSVYPNPFNPTTTISFALPDAAEVLLSVYDVNGRLVNTLVNGYRSAGIHKVTFDASDLPSGIYFAQIEAVNLHVMQKLILLK